MDPKVLAVIPARGGSKRVLRKNLRKLCGKPLIAHTIEAAQKAKYITTLVVSTDDEEIRDRAIDYGAYVVRRPDELADDDATSGSVLLHALQWFEAGEERYDIIMCLHPTSPIRDPEHIDQAVEMLVGSELPALASVCALPRKSHPNVGTIMDEDEWVGSAWPHYILNASIYAVKRDWLIKNKTHVPHGQALVPLEMDRYHSMDIDEEVDLAIAELFMKCLKI